MRIATCLRVRTILTRLVLAALVWTGALLLPAPLAAQSARPADDLRDLRRQALAAEKAHNWLKACQLHDEILHKDRGNSAAREGYRRSLRRYHQVVRHRDPGYRAALAKLQLSQALDIYEQVLGTVSAAYVDRSKTEPAALVLHGIEELQAALDEDAFRRQYLPGVKADDEGLPKLRSVLEGRRKWLQRWLRSPDRERRLQPREVVNGVIREVRKAGLPSKPLLQTAIGLEFAAGACNALDEYTLFLTPGHFSDVQATLRGKTVAVGLDLGTANHKLVIVRVYPRSPAAESGLGRNERVRRIDGRNVEDMLPEEAAERLRGAPGTKVVVEVGSGKSARKVTLVRRAVTVPSVEYEKLYEKDMASGEVVPFGYIRITHFQESTPQEVREAMADLQTGGSMRGPGVQGILLDLRGNPGGLFRSAVQVAELFLSEGVIAYTESQFEDYNRPFPARSMNPFDLRMFVLIDGDTASAAEVVAGALQDLGRARTVGQKTFGKNTIQCVIPLDKAPLARTPGGIRITVARFYSPLNHPTGARGVDPSIPVPFEGEAVLLEARRRLLELLLSSKPMTAGPPPMMPN